MLQEAIERTRVEMAENRIRAIHNSFTLDVDKLLPYENKHYLEMVGLVSKLLQFSRIKEKRINGY